jgi:uncharacterized Zn finger protein
MRENVEAKARRYLVEGRLVVAVVDGRRIVASCRGDGDVHRLGYDPARHEWRCTCPARGSCSHLVALRLVTRAPAERQDQRPVVSDRGHA